MIVRMKKVSLVVLDSHRVSSLERLRKLGVLHLEQSRGTDIASPDLQDLQERRNLLVQAVNLLSAESALPPQESSEDPLETARRVVALLEREQVLQEEIGRLRRQEANLAPWGDFDPGRIRALASDGIHLHLAQMTTVQLASLPEGERVVVLEEGKNFVRVAVLRSQDSPFDLPGTPFPIPDRGLSAVRAEIGRAEAEILRTKSTRAAAASSLDAIGQALTQTAKQIEFESVRLGMATASVLAHLTGYVPSDRVEPLQKEAADDGWALLIEEPDEEDPVPTLVRNPRWIEMIRPVFAFLGIVPGYTEYDISVWFLLFFSIFWAMIIGDAGYGSVFLVITLLVSGKLRKSSPQFFGLLFVTSVCTIIWGTITGNWFGSQTISQLAPLRSLTLGGIATFADEGVDVAGNVMSLCFIIGAVHITVAHLKNLFARLPKLVALAEIGWLGVLWGMYFVIQFIVLGKPGDSPVLPSMPAVSMITLQSAAVWLILGGLGFVVLFAEQKGKFIKGVLLGLANLPLKLLDSIGSFSDIVSYVRLFAVGLAGFKVAEAFNTMASGVGFGMPAGIAAGLILLFGHVLNVAMGALSLMVHGVRLNVLEFSNHLGMEWKGSPYAPFSDEKK